MIDEQLEQLISDLYRLTQSDKLDWQESANETTFLVSQPTFSVILDKRGTTEPFYYLYLVDDSGRIGEAIVFDELGDRSLFYNEVAELYQLVRRKVLRTDSLIANVLETV